ncbi:hypothetical protein DW352_07660 [Pseudolabrys taiwanensis]|uniref:Uncharacterized protein n=1 Tax=Pseudolabrys taiwanensis TaxID=331696 RepID=A0A345ZU06_9HYPH|nr:hypothetical protein DW352_07660 [Pseudolabrys taiwanensis]
MKGREQRHRSEKTAHLPRALEGVLGGCSLVRDALLWFCLHPWLRRFVVGVGVLVVLLALGLGGLWWRLSNGPIELDIVTPWLKAAIEQNFGGKHTVTVGGTQIERDENGHTSLRLRDIVVRDTDGTVVASAPKAEVGISGRSLLSGELRASSLNLVGAEMSVRIETDGGVTVFAGADKRPIATAAPPLTPPPPPTPADPAVGASPAVKTGLQEFAEALAFVDNVGSGDLDDLRQIGLKDGRLVVEDQRNGKRLSFERINVSLTRPSQGGIIFKIESASPERPWNLTAAMRPLEDGVRAVGIEARRISTRDILLALRLNDDSVDADLPLSASIRAEIAANGMPQMIQGQLLADAGTIADHADERRNIHLDRAEFRLNWDARRKSLIVPFQIQADGNQFTMRATVEAPAEGSTAWTMTLARGDAVIDPIIFGANQHDQESLALNRANARLRIDPARKRIDLEQGDFRRIDTRPSLNFGVAVTGSFDFSTPDPQLAFGVAANRMPIAVMKRVWPVFAATDVRSWVLDHISSGTVERILIAGNAPLSQYDEKGPPMAEEALSVDVETSDTTLKPVPDLPAIRDADLTVRITGGSASVNLGRGTIDVDQGRKLNIASGVFEIADTHQKPSKARATFRIDGTVPAAAAFLSSDAMRQTIGLSLDPASSRGTLAAQVAINFLIGKTAPPNSLSYVVNADLTNFAADKLLMGQKIEAAALKVVASSDAYQIKGDVKINGTPASIEVRKQKRDADAELKLTATLDEAARKRLGLDLGSALVGGMPIRLIGRVGDNVTDERMTVDADLTPVKIDNLLPGWTKGAGKAARATFTLIKSAKSMRFEDLLIDGNGANVKGALEVDNSGDLMNANFPVFSLSEGDKVTVKADRGNDNVLRVVVRGDVYDGRGFVKASMAGSSEKSKSKSPDIDLDIKIGTVAGHNGETLRGLDLKLGRRNGNIRSLSMSSKIGRDSPLIGDLRLRARDNHQVVYLETDDAGALFRFTDMYPRMFGGQMWVAMDPPNAEQTPQFGTLFIRNFVVRGEPALDSVVSNAPNGSGKGSVDFSEMRADFTRSTGKMSIRDGIVRGPLVGATVEGNIDYVRDEVHLRGTFVPFYGLNNMFGQIPIVGLFLGGGSNEGLVGIAYEATGPPGAPRLMVNPVTAIAPGLLRKFIPSPGSFDPSFVPPAPTR